MGNGNRTGLREIEKTRGRSKAERIEETRKECEKKGEREQETAWRARVMCRQKRGKQAVGPWWA